MACAQAQPVTIEVIGNHWLRCACYACEVPRVVQEFCRQTGVEMQFIGYRAWDIDDSSAVPEHIRLRLKAIREGGPDGGFFINGQWFSTGYHDGHGVVSAMQALYVAAGLDQEPPVVREYGQAVGKRESEGCTIENLRLADCAIGSLVSAESQVGKLFLGGGRIRLLGIGEHCQVDEFQYRGFDVNKLVEVARQHPELFGQAQERPQPGQQPPAVDPSQITVRALGLEDLRSGRHPCIIVEHPLDSGNALHLDAVEKFGAWGYVAEHNGRVCGFLSALPKISCIRDGSHVAPPDADPAKTLWLRCLAGGPVYGPEYARIGIATRMVEAALGDAVRRGYLCVEASPHDPHMGRMYEKLGFGRVAWLDPDSKQNVYYRKRLGVCGESQS